MDREIAVGWCRRPLRARPPGGGATSALLTLPGLLALAVLAAATAGCGATPAKAGAGPAAGTTAGTTAGTAAAASITIKDFSYHPATLHVAPGAVVTVHNADSATHTVTAASPHQGSFSTGDIQPGATVSFQAPETPGTYPYICEIHQFMHGTLVVG